jgi:hypothetical protein
MTDEEVVSKITDKVKELQELIKIAEKQNIDVGIRTVYFPGTLGSRGFSKLYITANKRLTPTEEEPSYSITYTGAN